MNKIPLSIICIIPFYLLFFSLVRAEEKTVPVSKAEKEILTRSRIEVPVNFIEAHDFEGQLVTGGRVRLADFKRKFLLLNFWATWCSPCLKELPDLDQVYRKLRQNGLAVIAVSMGESPKRVKKFLNSHQYSFLVITDSEMEITRLYGVQKIPITYLVDSSGAILGRALGPRKWSAPELLEFFRSRLSNRPS